MKKLLLSLLVAGFMGVALVGCGGEKKKPEDKVKQGIDKAAEGAKEAVDGAKEAVEGK